MIIDREHGSRVEYPKLCKNADSFRDLYYRDFEIEIKDDIDRQKSSWIEKVDTTTNIVTYLKDAPWLNENDNREEVCDFLIRACFDLAYHKLNYVTIYDSKFVDVWLWFISRLEKIREDEDGNPVYTYRK